jgi:hypothetical protein
MTKTDRRVLELALIGLETERERIEQELNSLRARLRVAPPATSGVVTRLEGPSLRRPGPNKGRKMSAAQKKKISDAMKARWLVRKRAARA